MRWIVLLALLLLAGSVCGQVESEIALDYQFLTSNSKTLVFADRYDLSKGQLIDFDNNVCLDLPVGELPSYVQPFFVGSPGETIFEVSEFEPGLGCQWLFYQSSESETSVKTINNAGELLFKLFKDTKFYLYANGAAFDDLCHIKFRLKGTEFQWDVVVNYKFVPDSLTLLEERMYVCDDNTNHFCFKSKTGEIVDVTVWRQTLLELGVNEYDTIILNSYDNPDVLTREKNKALERVHKEDLNRIADLNAQTDSGLVTAWKETKEQVDTMKSDMQGYFSVSQEKQADDWNSILMGVVIALFIFGAVLVMKARRFPWDSWHPSKKETLFDDGFYGYNPQSLAPAKPKESEAIKPVPIVQAPLKPKPVIVVKPAVEEKPLDLLKKTVGKQFKKGKVKA